MQRQQRGDARGVHVAEAGGDVVDPGRPCSRGRRSPAAFPRGTCGTGSVWMATMRTWSCSTWLCSTLARMASGAVALPRLRKIAVPGTRGSGGFLSCSSSMNSRSDPSSRWRCAADQLPPLLPGGEDGEHQDADGERQPGPVRQLGEVGGEEQQVDGEQHGGTGEDEPQRLLPLAADDVEEQQRGDGDRAGDRHAVRVGQRGRGAEREDQREHRDAQRPVDPRDVDLPDPFLRGVLDAQPRQVPDLGGLLGQRERAGDDRLGGDDRRGGGQDHHRDPPPPGRQQEEGVADRARDGTGRGRPAPCS